MKDKKVVWAVAATVVIITTFSMITTVQNLATKKVAFHFVDRNGYVRLLGKDDVEVARFYNDTELKIKAGEYRLVAESSDYVVAESSVKVTGDVKVDIEYSFSDRRLEELLTQAVIDELNGEIVRTFPRQMEDYIITKHRLFGDADWAGVVVESRSGQEDNIQMMYRAVLRKEGGKWGMVGYPELILTVYTHPGVPIGVIDKINLFAV